MSVTAEIQTESWQRVDIAYAEFVPQVEERLARTMGAIALAEVVEVCSVEEQNPSTLLAGLQEAALGDAASKAMVDKNVATDVSERLFKIGRGGKPIELDISADNRILQHGRHVVDIQANTFKHTRLNEVMQRRSKAEMRNLLFVEALLPTGVLDDHAVLTWSPATQDEVTKEKYNFFVDTDSCSVQLLSKIGDKMELQTALVAGKKHASAPRHDLQAIQTIADEESLDLIASDADEVVQYMMLVPKSLVPDGINDVVQRYDETVGGVFYGQESTRSDYQDFARECVEREAAFSGIVSKISDQLIREAHLFKTPFDAIKRLDELSEQYCVVQATEDVSLDAAVFGLQAAVHIEEARRALANGDEIAASQAIEQAQKTATSGSCPLDKSMINSGDKDKDDSSDGKKKWMNCPHCKAKVYDDPCASVLACGGCRAMVVHGHVVSKGNTARKAKKAEAALARQIDEAVPVRTVDRIISEVEKEHAQPAPAQPALVGQ
jgi:hypothetical protein